MSSERMLSSAGLIGKRVMVADGLSRLDEGGQVDASIDLPDGASGVKVDKIVEDPAPARLVYQPGNPQANKDGYVYQSNVSEVGEMVEMMAAARSYQNNVEVINTARQLMMRTLDITKA